VDAQLPEVEKAAAARAAGVSFAGVLQVLAILGLVAIIAMIFHKAYLDLDKLAQKYSGVEFWVELAKQVLKNLAAGG
jgi:hypothetical protein